MKVMKRERERKKSEEERIIDPLNTLLFVPLKNSSAKRSGRF